MMIMNRLVVVILLSQLLLAVDLSAQSEKMKALFLLNFTKNIKWDEGENNQPVSMLIIGDKLVYDELAQLAARTQIGTRSIKVVHSDGCPEGNSKFEVVYLSNPKSNLLPDVLKKCSQDPTLVVTDTKDGCKMGAGINFVSKSGKISYEINKRVIEKNGLRVGNTIINLGTPVE